jgi:hypothetical protein
MANLVVGDEGILVAAAGGGKDKRGSGRDLRA